MPRLCINCLLAESPCATHLPTGQGRSARPRGEAKGQRQATIEGGLKELCEF
jgi:hypothetical protein